MSDADPVLAAIQARVYAAVEGPWFFDGYCRVQSGPRLDAYNQWDADTPADLPEDDPRWDAEPETIMAKTQNITSAARDGKPHGDLGTIEGIANGEFIAHARTDIPLLLAALSEARSQALEEAAAAINAQCCHADERWNVQYTADDCQFCQPVMKAVRKLGETQA